MKRVLSFPQNLEKDIKIRLEESPWADIKAFVKTNFLRNQLKMPKLKLLIRPTNYQISVKQILMATLL